VQRLLGLLGLSIAWRWRLRGARRQYCQVGALRPGVAQVPLHCEPVDDRLERVVLEDSLLSDSLPGARTKVSTGRAPLRPNRGESKEEQTRVCRKDKAGVEDRAYYQKIGFDLPAMLGRWGVKAELGNFRVPRDKQ
jgi:hypothetical protein